METGRTPPDEGPTIARPASHGDQRTERGGPRSDEAYGLCGTLWFTFLCSGL
jgi:hypothetical protein